MATIYYDKDANLSDLEGQTIAIIGFGSQGHAHAMNLRDSGVNVIIGHRGGENSATYNAAKEAGFHIFPVAEATKKADIIQVLIPDTIQKEIYENEIEPNLEAGNSLMFAHGLNINYGMITPPDNIDVFMIAPKGPGHLVRDEFVADAGVPCLVAIYQDATGNALKKALAYASAIGGGRAGVIKTTFKEETETDLFGEQAVLCGGSAALIKMGFETLIEAGYQPEIAYFEVMHELKLIVDLYYRGGLKYMNYSVSETAEYGGLTVGPRIITEESRKAMKETLARIQNGEFAKEWMEEYASGGKNFQKLRDDDANHPVEQTGEKLRNMMSWIK
ncbi:MAG: ketol-acid reductoisomerase [Candidatus Hydrogenedentota bacterium]|nr:MAG: ketol-acid reductoisomerase [Candidatus Hydrogenedentota bacterium]